MEALSKMLPIIIYFLLIVLLIILITFGIKLLMTVLKLEKAVEDFTKRLESFKSLFTAVDLALDKISKFGDVALDFISDRFKKNLKRKRKEIYEDE